jgi:hypothetical protein
MPPYMNTPARAFLILAESRFGRLLNRGLGSVQTPPDSQILVIQECCNHGGIRISLGEIDVACQPAHVGRWTCECSYKSVHPAVSPDGQTLTFQSQRHRQESLDTTQHKQCCLQQPLPSMPPPQQRRSLFESRQTCACSLSSTSSRRALTIHPEAIDTVLLNVAWNPVLEHLCNLFSLCLQVHETRIILRVIPCCEPTLLLRASDMSFPAVEPLTSEV